MHPLIRSWLASWSSQRSPSQQRFPWALQLIEQILKEQITDIYFSICCSVCVLLLAVVSCPPMTDTALPCAENLFSRCGVKLGEYDGTPHGRAVLNYLSSFRGRNVLPLKPFQRLLGHMASVAAVTPLGLLHMRSLQHWLHSRILRWAWRRGTLRVSITHHSATRNTFARFYSLRVEPVSSCVLGNR